MNTESSRNSKKQIVVNNLLGGIARGVGSVLGATIVVALLGFIITKINVIPVVGSLVADIVKTVEQKSR